VSFMKAGDELTREQGGELTRNERLSRGSAIGQTVCFWGEDSFRRVRRAS